MPSIDPHALLCAAHCRAGLTAGLTQTVVWRTRAWSASHSRKSARRRHKTHRTQRLPRYGSGAFPPRRRDSLGRVCRSLTRPTTTAPAPVPAHKHAPRVVSACPTRPTWTRLSVSRFFASSAQSAAPRSSSIHWCATVPTIDELALTVARGSPGRRRQGGVRLRADLPRHAACHPGALLHTQEEYGASQW